MLFARQTRDMFEDMTDRRNEVVETQGNPEPGPSAVSRVGPAPSTSSAFISCLACRARKVKCTGERPKCMNCRRRQDSCVYEAVVRRRGPDKKPGARLQRPPPPPPDLSQPLSDPESDRTPPRSDPSLPYTEYKTSYTSKGYASSSSPGSVRDDPLCFTMPFGLVHVPGMPPEPPSAWPSQSGIVPHPYELDQYGFPTTLTPRRDIAAMRTPPPTRRGPRATHETIPMYVPPGHVEAAREGWWTWILDGYSSDRAHATRTVVDMCKEFFSNSHVWLSALNQPLFFRSLLAPNASFPRQPHIILAILAHVAFHSSDADIPAQARAMRFADESRKIIDHSLISGNKSPTLAQAALVLAVFEMQPHYQHSSKRSADALVYLDTVGMACWATRMDAGEGQIELVNDSTVISASGPKVSRHLKNWALTPPWGDWVVAEIRKEEMRRMIWIATSMAAGLSLWSKMLRKKMPKTQMSQPGNFGLMYPGEAAMSESSDRGDGRNSPWALYFRAAALWQEIAPGQLDRPGREAVLAQLADIDAQLTAQERLGINNYVWLAKDWVLVAMRHLSAIDPATIKPWFAKQLFILRAFVHPPPGRPRAAERPLYSWWFLMQGFSAVELTQIDAECKTMAIELVGLCLQALGAICRRYPCDFLAGIVHVLGMKHRALGGGV